MLRRKGEVIIPEGMKPRPMQHELDVAQILARHYKCVVEFLQPIASYKTKTPDIVMNGVMWEIKSPTGNSKKSTLESQFNGLKQSRNLIIDARRTKLDDTFVQAQIEKEISKHAKVGKILCILKTTVVFEIR